MVEEYQNNYKSIQILVLIMFALTTSEAKMIANTFQPNDIKLNQGWIYLGRTKVQPGNLSLSVQLKIRSFQLRNQTLLDFEFAAVPAQLIKQQTENKCNLKNYDENTLKNNSNKILTIQASVTKQNRLSKASKNFQIEESTTYHLIMKDCMKTYLQQYLTYYTQLEINLAAVNNQTYFASNQYHNIWTLPLFIILSYAILHFLKQDKDSKTDNWATYIFRASIWLGIVSLLCKYIDHLLYAYSSGWHYNFLDAMCLIIQSVSDAAVLFLIILIAFGWTITFDQHADFDLWLPMSLLASFTYMVVAILNKSRDNWVNRFHVYDTFAGYIMVGIRVALLAVFAYAIRHSFKEITTKDSRLKTFFTKFAVFGVAYLAFLPLCMVLAELASQQNRYECMYLLLEVFRLSLQVWLAVLMSWNNSCYKKAISYVTLTNKDKKI